MKFKELFSINEGVFTIINTRMPELYKEFFDDVLTPLELDIYAFNKVGELEVMKHINNDNKEQILMSVLKVGDFSLKRMLKALTESYDILSTSIETESKQGDQNTTDMQNRTNTDSNKAFNSTDFEPYERQVNDVDGSTDKKYNETTARTKTGGGSDNIQSVINEIEFRKCTSVADTLLEYITDRICLNIYL